MFNIFSKNNKNQAAVNQDQATASATVEAPIQTLYIESRPWGIFKRFTQNAPSTVKILEVKIGQSTSLQFHKGRSEYWYVVSGTGILTIGEQEMPAVVGQSYVVGKMMKHRIKAGTEPLVILEISTGNFDEKDIIRLEDIYGRTGSPQ